MKINGNRAISGVLRGFDAGTMNLALQNAIEEVSATERNPIGTIVIRGTWACKREDRRAEFEAFPEAFSLFVFCPGFSGALLL